MATIEHADSLTLLSPGDVVIVEAGTYAPATPAGVVLQNSGGTNGAPVTYLANGNVMIDQSGATGESFGFQVQSPWIVLSGFEVKGAAHGISLDASQVWTGNDCVVTNCVIRDSAPVNSSGVFLRSCNNALVVRNVIYHIDAGGDTPWGNVGCGVRVSSGDNNKVWNNTIENCYIGVFYYGTSPGGPGYGHLSTLNNIVVNSRGWGFVNPWNTDATWFDSGWNLVFNDAVTYGNFPAGNNAPLPTDVAADPTFVFPLAHDYHLLAGSPALEAGTDLGLPFQGAAPDIGAFEGVFPPAAIGTISGKVTANLPGNPGVPGAVVRTLDGTFSATTDVNGNFSLVLPQGSSTLNVSAGYFGTTTSTTNVSSGAVVTVNFSLALTNSPRIYYVDNGSGNDSNPGTATQPWKNVGNGDATGVLNPGDTVIVNAGTYPQASSNGVSLVKQWGYEFAPITYKAAGTVMIDQSSFTGTSYGFNVAVAGVLLNGFEIKGAQHGIYLAPGSHSGTIDSCVVHDGNGTGQDTDGIFVNQCIGVAVVRNLVYNMNSSANTPWSPVGSGIRVQGADNLRILNNTIDNAYIGLFYYGGGGPGAGPYGSITTLNNIVVNCAGWAFVNPWSTDTGLFRNGYNLLLDDAVTYGNFPAGNDAPLPTDLAELDPGFVNGPARNYQLQSESPALNSGIDVGLPFTGLAPDLGALESSFVPPLRSYYVDNANGNDAHPGTQAQPWKTIGNGDAKGVVNPGDTVIVSAGAYPQATESGVTLAVRHGVPNAPITYRADGRVVIDQSSVAGTTYGFKVSAAGMALEGFEVTGASHGVYFSPGSDNGSVTRSIIHDAAPGTGNDVSGIYVDRSANVTLSGNVIFNINAAANTPWAPIGSGIRAGYSPNLKVLNNTIDNAHVGVFYHGPAPGGGPYGHITTHNNIVVNSAGWAFVNPWLTDPTFFTSSHNLVFNDAVTYGNFPAGNNGPLPFDVSGQDPKFVDPTGGDYRLQAGSPAIDTGINVGLSYAGIAPDLGAYEAEAITGPALTITGFGTNLMISWPGGGTLQSSTNPAGGYTDEPQQSNPFPVTANEAKRFYRLRQ